MHISLIVALAADNVIGNDGAMPWNLPEDLQHFKRVTMGKPIVMGRATWDSIGRPLPGRQNIVVTRQTHFTADGCDIAHSLDEAIALAGEVPEVMVIGGGQIYAQALPLATRIYLTRIDADVDGDTRFPPLDLHEWTVTSRVEYPQDTNRAYSFSIETLERNTN